MGHAKSRLYRACVPLQASARGHAWIERKLRERDVEIVRLKTQLAYLAQEREQVEHEQRILLDELEHRVKNLIMTVLAIARHTIKAGPDGHNCFAKFEERLIALHRAHQVLSENRSNSVQLRALLEVVLSPYRDSARHSFVLRGSRIELPSSAAQSLALVFNELATNAAKYGAVAVPGGRVSVTWSETRSSRGDKLQIEWVEDGGPPVDPDAEPGFGTRFINGTITRQFDGEAVHTAEQSGMHWRFVIPLPLGGNHVPDHARPHLDISRRASR